MASTELKAIRSGELKIGNLIMKVHVFENGQKIIEEQSLIDFIEWMGKGELTTDLANKFAKDLKNF